MHNMGVTVKVVESFRLTEFQDELKCEIEQLQKIQIKYDVQYSVSMYEDGVLYSALIIAPA